MQDGNASVTAERVANRRAAHQVLDHPRVFEDPLALRIVGADEESIKNWASLRSLRAFMAVRSRYCEDQLAEAFRRGVTQYVILGAGLDTFAYRNPYPEGALRVFEVDHPATQAWKRDRLREAGIAIPVSVVFAPTDFERNSLREGLQEAGFCTDQMTFFAWLGVTPYLSEEAFEATVRFMASTPRGGGAAFDYAVTPELLTTAEKFVLDFLSNRVAAAGEPFQLFFDPLQLAERLKRAGFQEVEDLGSDEINRRYFDGRSDGLQVSAGLAHLVSARI